MSTLGKIIVAVIVIIILVWIGYYLATQPATPTDQSGEPIKIGFIGPLTGELANIGTNAKAAVEIAVEEVNAAGGINGSNLEVIFEDDQCAGPKAESAVSKLTSVDQVPAIIGSVCSPATLAAAPIVEQAQTVMVSFCSTAATITQ